MDRSRLDDLQALIDEVLPPTDEPVARFFEEGSIMEATMDALEQRGSLVASGGIAAPALALGPLNYVPMTLVPRFTAQRGHLYFVQPGRPPLMGEAAERWQLEQDRAARIAERERLITENFCSCREVNIGWDDDYEADYVRARGNCEVHGWDDGPGW